MYHQIFLALLLPCLAHSQSLVLIGGGLTDGNAAIWNKVVELAGGPGVAKIGIFTTASADPLDSAIYYEDMFVNVYGALSATYIPITETSGNANDPAVVDLIGQQTGFFFGGGDQLRIAKALKNVDYTDTLALAAVKSVFLAGGVVGGTSAGAAAAGKTFMLTGGVSFDSLVYGAYSGGPNPDFPNDLSFDENGGIGFLDGYVIDTHFSERGREGRLIRLLQDTKMAAGGVPRGFGLDEDTALAITNVGTAAALGEVVGTTGGVFFADVTDVVETPSETTDYRGVKTAFLTSGDKIAMPTGEINFAAWKTPLKGDEYYLTATSSSDIFSSRADGEFRFVAKRLFDNQLNNVISSYSYERRPVEFEVVMDRYYGYAYAGYLPDGTFVVSHADLTVDIHESAFSKNTRKEKIVKHSH